MKKVKHSRSKLVKLLDKAFSEYTRVADADEYGRVSCFTCGVRKHFREVDAGHFQSRAKYSTRWDTQNVKPQCKKCNMMNGGQQYIFGRNLDAKYGAGTAMSVVHRSNVLSHFSREELEARIDEFRGRFQAISKGFMN